MFAVPAAPTLRLPRFWPDTRVPPVTLARFVTLPPESVDVPAVTFSESSVPPVRFKVAPEVVAPVTDPPLTVAEPLLTARLPSVAALSRVPPETVVTLAEPPVRLAVPPLTVRSASVTLELSVPAVTVVVPVTLPPVRLVALLLESDANEPPVAFKAPALVVAPIVPAEMFAVPAAPTLRLPRPTDDSRVPPVTLARFVTEPVVSVLFPPVTFSAVSVPPTRLSSPAELAVVMVPAEMLAVAPD